MHKHEEGLRSRRGVGGSGGIGGSGVFGHFGTTIQCKSDDKSWFCMFSKFMSVLIMLMVLFFILSFVYDIIQGLSRKKMRSS
jgi:hypothetical protein